jgi:cytochrome P450
MLLLTAGREATVDGINNALWFLAEHATERDWLAQRLDDAAAVRTAVEEFLRNMSPIQLLGRISTRDTTLHGVTIPEGESLGVLYGAANRDEAEFPQASSCVLDRRRNPHLAFGVGVHTCLGAHLARLDLRVAIRQLLRRIPDFSLDAEPVWAPNGDTRGFRSLQIRFTPSELPASGNTMGNAA